MDTQKISEKLLGWYSAHYRPLPWRNEPTPYHVWISEIMLQQTRIEAVLPYYRRFIEALPTVADLARVPMEQLLKLWEGLGYYSRARNLQKAAQLVMAEHNGEIPADYDALLSLPGVGSYTAGAIASIAFDIPVPAVDGNVMRVLARLTADDTDVLSTEGKKKFTDLAWQLVPQEHAGRFNQALMELGETVCLPNGTPRCEMCPLKGECQAYRDDCVQNLPVRIKKVSRRVENRQLAVVRVTGHPPKVLLHKRPGEGLLADLWEIPNTMCDDALAGLPEQIALRCVEVGELPACKHLFSHIEWRMNGKVYEISTAEDLPIDFAAVDWNALQKAYPLPGAFKGFINVLAQLLCEEC